MAYKIAESCMLFDFGLEIGECASWVQAWGSICAILAAGAIARYQIKAAHKAEQQRAGARVQAVIAIAEAFSDLLASTAGAFDRPPEMVGKGRMWHLGVSWNESAFRSAEATLAAFPLHDLPSAEAVQLLLNFRSLIVTAREAVDRLSRSNAGPLTLTPNRSPALDPVVQAARANVTAWKAELHRVLKA